MTAITDGTYLRKGFASLRFDRSVHDADQLTAEGWEPYDPLKPGDDACTDTHAWLTGPPCYHAHAWECPQAPREFWYPLASEPRFRDREYLLAHREEVSKFVAGGGDLGLASRDEYVARLKALRAEGKTWREVFAVVDG